MAGELPFLGRVPQLNLLDEALGNASAGRRTVVSITGAPGSGKSRLIDEFEQRSVRHDVELRRTRSLPTSATQPGAIAAALGLDELPAGRTVVLLLDDAHWADPTSVSDLRDLLLEPRDNGLLLVLSHRPVDARETPSLQRLVEVADRRDALQRVEIGPLPAEALRGAVSGDDAGDVAERLHRASGGVPLALADLVEQLVDAGLLRRDGDTLVTTGPLAAWPDVRTRNERVADLPRDARLLVRSAALASHPIALPVAVNLLGGETDEVLDLAEDLVDQGHLAESPAGFLPPTATAAEEVTRELGAVRRGRIHAALADAMVAAGLDESDPALVGTHQLRAGRAEAALAPLSEAGLDAVGRGAFAEALPLVSRALEALDQRTAPDRHLEGRLLYARARCHRMLGRSDLAADDADDAIRWLTDAERMRALGWRAQIADDLQQATEGERFTAMAELEAARQGDHATLGTHLTLRAKMLGRIGLPDEADACLRRGVRLLRLHGDDDDRFLGHWNGAWLAFDRGQVSEAASGFEYCVHQARYFASEEWLAQAQAWHARALFWSGRVSDAIEVYDLARDAADRTDSAGPAFLAALGRAEGMALIGRDQEALRAADESLDVVHRDIPVWENAVRYARAVAMLGAGEIAEARIEAQRALEACPAGADGLRWRLACRALLMEIHADGGGALAAAETVALSRELLAARWFVPAIRLLTVRAAHEARPEIARQAAALALELGIPALAARAIDAGDLWDEATSAAVATAVRDMEPQIPNEWREGWRTRAEIAASFEVPPAEPAVRREAAVALRGDLEELLQWVALVPTDLRSGPREWTAPLPRPPEVQEQRKRRLTVAVASVAALALVGAVVGGLAMTRTDDLPVAADEAGVPTIEPSGMIAGTWALGGGPERTGVAHREGSGITSFDGLYWTECTGQAIRSSPAVFGQFVYVGSDDEHLHRFHTTTGRQRWTRPTDGQVRSSPYATTGVGEGGLAQAFSMVFVGSEDGSVRAWTRDGDFHWEFPTGGPVESSPVVVDGRLYVGSRDGRLYALTADLGELIWQWPPEGDEAAGGIRSSPAVSGDLVYVGSDDRNVYAIERDTGDERWRFTTGGGVQHAPVVSDGVVYVASQDEHVHSLDAATGRPVGMVQYQMNAPLRASPAIADGHLYVPNLHYLVAIDIETGRDVWSLATGREITSSPVIAGDHVYVGSTDGNVYAVHRHEGGIEREPAWIFESEGEIWGSPAVADGAVFVGSGDGCLYALGHDVHTDPADDMDPEPDPGIDDDPLEGPPGDVEPEEEIPIPEEDDDATVG